MFWPAQTKPFISCLPQWPVRAPEVFALIRFSLSLPRFPSLLSQSEVCFSRLGVHSPLLSSPEGAPVIQVGFSFFLIIKELGASSMKLVRRCRKRRTILARGSPWQPQHIPHTIPLHRKTDAWNDYSSTSKCVRKVASERNGAHWTGVVDNGNANLHPTDHITALSVIDCEWSIISAKNSSVRETLVSGESRGTRSSVLPACHSSLARRVYFANLSYFSPKSESTRRLSKIYNSMWAWKKTFPKR